MAKLDFSPIADTTRRAEIVALLRRAILTGQLEPGQKLNELRISEQMRVSRAPLREAMRELVQEGILTSIPYAGTFVIEVTAKDIIDAYSLNQVLDEFAIERTWPLRDQRFFDELDRARRLLHRFVAPVKLIEETLVALWPCPFDGELVQHLVERIGIIDVLGSDVDDEGAGIGDAGQDAFLH